MRKIKGVLPKSVKANIWRKIVDFDPLKDNVFHYDDTVEVIAEVYGIGAEDVEAELELSEILPTFLECVEFVNKQVFMKLEGVSKKKQAE